MFTQHERDLSNWDVKKDQQNFISNNYYSPALRRACENDSRFCEVRLKDGSIVTFYGAEPVSKEWVLLKNINSVFREGYDVTEANQYTTGIEVRVSELAWVSILG